MNKLQKAIKNPHLIFWELAQRGTFNWIPDKLYIKVAYRIMMGQKLDLENPKRFSEKLQWLKFNDVHTEYRDLVDKYEAKEKIQRILGAEHIIPTLAVYNSVEEIELDKLPERFAIKTTHDSGGVVVCKNRNLFDWEKAKQRLAKSYKHNFFGHGREYPYKDIKPRIIVEKFVDLNGPECAEYKLFCFNGKVKYILVCKGEAHKTGSRTNDFFDRDFNELPITMGNLKSKTPLQKPSNMQEIIDIAEKLADGITQVRVDFYVIGESILFGEMTFFHNSGLSRFSPSNYDEIWGSELVLPKETK